jgi:uncharacterized protein YacL
VPRWFDCLLSRNRLPNKLLDSCVLIDGRILDILRSNFLEGTLVVPEFVIHELQKIANSADSARRGRGRRGLDVLKDLQNVPGMRVEIERRDFPGVPEVDLKLVELAKLRRAAIVTNDVNLSKVARLCGIRVLNVNELANALKPVVLPGETMRVLVVKEGKEPGQGVAYLDDGTMIVVDNGRPHISRTIAVIVTSVLQTNAGKMIFAKYDQRQPS